MPLRPAWASMMSVTPTPPKGHCKVSIRASGACRLPCLFAIRPGEGRSEVAFPRWSVVSGIFPLRGKTGCWQEHRQGRAH